VKLAARLCRNGLKISCWKTASRSQIIDVKMTQLEYITRVLSLINPYDCDEILWNIQDGKVRFQVNCSDVFIGLVPIVRTLQKKISNFWKIVIKS
jgi:hypothetical protein